MYVYLNKKEVNGHYFFDIYFMGVQTSAKVTKEQYENCPFKTGDLINDDFIETFFYKKGYDVVLSLKLK